MRLTQPDIHRINKLTYKKNCIARYKSPEEKQFTLAAAAGLLLMWRPYVLQDNLQMQAEQSAEKITVGLPAEIGQLVGNYLTRKEAVNVVKTCDAANKSACLARKEYIEKHGKSYEEDVYVASLFLF